MAESACVNVHYTNVTSENISRQNAIKWVNSILKTKLHKIEDLCKGDVYCQFMNLLFPGCIPMKKVKLNSNQEFAYIQNYKYLQAAFEKVGCDKYVPVDKLIKGRFQDNFEFLQWFRKFFLANCHNQGIETDDQFSEHTTDKESVACPVAIIAPQPDQNRTFDKLPSAVLGRSSSNVKELENEVKNLKSAVIATQNERDFYLEKLLEIEKLCSSISNPEFKEAICEILNRDSDEPKNAQDSLDEFF